MELEIEFAFTKYDLPFRKGNKPQLTQETFEIVAIATEKPPTYIIKDEQEEVIRGKSTRRNYVESFEYGFISSRVGFQRIFAALSKQYPQFISKFHAGASEFERTIGGSIFHGCTKTLLRGNLCFTMRNSPKNRGLLS